MEVGEWSISSPASKFLLGAPWSEKLAQGWVHPLRISPNQLRVIGSCSSWHPGLFKQMAACTSDIQVAFTTDSSEVALDLKIDKFLREPLLFYSYLKLRMLKSSALYL